METIPTAAELIEAATECLRLELLPKLDGRAAFQARVAANVLDIARRELLAGPAADAAEARRLSALLALTRAASTEAVPAPADPASAEPASADLARARRELCDAIREGRIDLATPGLAGHLWADVLARLAIEQPTYPSYLRETGADAGPRDPRSPDTPRT